jgi:hypothetical protein
MRELGSPTRVSAATNAGGTPRAVVSGGAGFIDPTSAKRSSPRHTRPLRSTTSSPSRRQPQGLEGKPGFEFRKHSVSEPIRVDGDVLRVTLRTPASRPSTCEPHPHTEGRHPGDMNMLGPYAKSATFLLASTPDLQDPPHASAAGELLSNVNPMGRGAADEGEAMRRLSRCITAHMTSIRGSSASSTRTVLACRSDRRAVPNSWPRFAESRSRSTATARRRAPSARLDLVRCARRPRAR